MRKILWIAAVLFTACAASAQSFSVFDIDTSNFPIMKAKFYAFDAAGKQQNPMPSEIDVSEDGVFRKVVSIKCPPAPPEIRLSTLLSIDISSSMMGNSGGEDYLTIAKAGASFIIQNLSLGLNESAVSSFNYDSYINQDFTTDQLRLLNAIALLQLENGTDYDKALFLQVAGALEITKKAKYKPVLIFISDGYCNTLQQQTIIAKAKSQGCVVYPVIVGPTCPLSLKDVATETGGQWFENISSPQEILSIGARILSEIQEKFGCEIEWESDPTCTNSSRQTQFNWRTLVANVTTILPFQAFARLEISPSPMYIISKAIGQKFDTTLDVKAINANFTVIDILNSNTQFDINPKSFTINSGETRTITVSFTPIDSNYSWTSLDIITNRCSKKYYVNASYPGKKPTAITLKVTEPNGGEYLVVGSDTLITWTGIPLTDTVRIDYSIDYGKTWVTISNKATGGKYFWKVPKAISNACLVKVSQLTHITDNWVRVISNSGYDNYARRSATDIFGNIYIAGRAEASIVLAKYRPTGELEWMQSAGGAPYGAGYAVACDLFGNAFLTGTFSGTAKFDSISLVVTKGQENIFVAKYHSDGSIEWAKRAGSSGWMPAEVNAGLGIVADNEGNVFVTGTTVGDSADFDNIILASGQQRGEIFIAKYLSNGDVAWAKRAGSIDEDGSYGISIDNLANVYVTGFFSGVADFGNDTLVSKGQQDIFVVKYDKDGNFVWVKQIGAAGEDGGNSIAIDSSNNIYLTGYIQGTVDFGGIQLQSIWHFDLFIAKYYPDGTLAWAKQAGGGRIDRGVDIGVDMFGNPYLSGHFQGTAYFDEIALKGPIDSLFGYSFVIAKYNADGKIEWAKYSDFCKESYVNGLSFDRFNNIYASGTFKGAFKIENKVLKSGGGNGDANGDIFIWKIGSDVLQSDTSDALFSIVMPQPLSQDIDMGDVLVGKMRDSVVTTFVTNGGSYQFRVDSIAVLNNAEFALQSNNTPFIVPVSGSQIAEFRFQPTTPGPKSAQVMIITQADTLYQTITGNGIQPIISTVGTVIDFGPVETMTSRDTTISVAITNNGTIPVDFSGDAQLGPDKTQFSLLSGGGAFTLAPNESRAVSIRFAPRFIGRTSGRIGFNYNGPGSPAILQLFGQGLGGLVKIADDSAYPGEKRNIAMELVGNPSASLQSLATGFRARVAYNSTVLAPFGGNVVRGSGVDTVTVEGNLNTDNTLTSMPFIAGLGNADVSSMDLVEFVWLDAQGQPANYDVETESGTFRLLGVCDEGGKRLFNPDGQVAITRISPNPASESMQVEIETLEAGRTQVVLMDVLGRTIATLYDGEIASGAHKLLLNTSKLSAGSYYLSLVTPTVKRFARVDVAR